MTASVVSDAAVDAAPLAPEEKLFEHADGAVRLVRLPAGRWRIRVTAKPGFLVPHGSWDTSYPLALIEEIYSAKGLYVCDEIRREEDPRYVERYLRREVLGYLPEDAFRGKRILDFGCGSGASSVVLSRILPECNVVGVELEERLLRIARLRAAHFGLRRTQFLRSPAGDALPEGLEQFDCVIFSAVFEHLLPCERTTLLPLVWSALKPGGILFLNQTPYRYSPVEIHTTSGMPLINYLPDRVVLEIVRRYSKRYRGEVTWERLLRDGIRGGSIPEILGILAGHNPLVLAPRREIGDRIDLWYGTLSSRHRWVKRSIWAALKALKAVARVEITPTLSLAIRKGA